MQIAAQSLFNIGDYLRVDSIISQILDVSYDSSGFSYLVAVNRNGTQDWVPEADVIGKKVTVS